jgi:hypothetical protein|tara:strand:- start:96020 stop:96139 length:120 start_codon:yes stop_codon:yes gene_type:complete
MAKRPARQNMTPTKDMAEIIGLFAMIIVIAKQMAKVAKE